ncbi:MAG: hypothetical protein K8R68_02285 [Bacteroidales bacterium]|nr:hypothetical protein [Bacteroidales bacterium]
MNELRIEYFRNSAFKRFIKRLESVLDSCEKISDLRKETKEKEIIFEENIRDIVRELKDLLSNTRRSLTKEIINILFCDGKSDFNWKNNYKKFYNLLKNTCDKGDNYTSDISGLELERKFFNKIRLLEDQCYKIKQEIKSSLVRGMVDFCVLPTKNRIESEILPSSGTLLGFDLEKSKLLKSDFKEKVRNEARRVGFQNEAWEWSDEGDSLILVFSNHESEPTIIHQERAVLTALELTSRINYKFVIGNEDLLYKKGKKANFTSHLQRLRIALNSWSGDQDSMDQALAELKYVLDDKSLKFTNTLFVIGDDLLSSLRGKYEIYRFNFCRVQKQHKRTGESIYWSSPIGWRNLRLFLGGSFFYNGTGIIYRDYRYQVPGNMSIKLLSERNGTDCNGTIHDISTKGVRVLVDCREEIIKKHFPKNSKISFAGLQCNSTLFDKTNGSIAYHTYLYDKNISYLGIKFSKNLQFSQLLNFLTECNTQCY